MKKVMVVFILFFVILWASACGDDPTNVVDYNTDNGIVTFTADKDKISLDECAILHWEVVDAKAVILNQEDAPYSGKMQVCPQMSMTFTLQADMGDRIETRELSIIVDDTDETILETEDFQGDGDAISEATDLETPEPDTWQQLGGPPGGLGYDIRMVPENPEIMYVTSSPGGIFKSVDGGENWFDINAGIEPYKGAGAPIFTATIDPHDSNTIWIGTQFTGKIYRSTDAGQTWQDHSNGIQPCSCEHSVRGITIDPNHQNVVYAGLEKSPGLGGVEGEVYKSEDGGKNWDLIWHGDNLARYIWIDPNNSQRVFVSTGIFDRDPANAIPEEGVCGGVGILKSDDAGKNWTSLDEKNGLGGKIIPSLFMHPVDSNILLAAIHDLPYCEEDVPGIYVSRDGGESWQQLITKKSDHNNFAFEAVEISTKNPEVWYAAGENIFYRSKDAGATWDQFPLIIPSRGSGVPIDLQVDPRDSNRIFVNSYRGGNLMSEDGGETWVDATKGYTGATIYGISINSNDGKDIFASSEAALFRSLDGGKTWIATQFPNAEIHDGAQALEYTQGLDGTKYILASGTLLNDSIYLSQDNGYSWEFIPLYEMPPGRLLFGRALIAAPSHPQIVYFGYSEKACINGEWIICDGDTTTTGLFHSEDGGKSWEHLTDVPFFGSSILSIAVHPENPNLLYVATISGLYRTNDGGKEWEKVLSAEKAIGWAPTMVERVGPVAFVVKFDPTNPNTIYIGNRFNGVWRSEDSGETWLNASFGLEPNESVFDLEINTNYPGVVYLSTMSSGAYISDDFGSTWHSLSKDQRFSGFREITSTLEGLTLFVGTSGKGVFKLSSP
jgi:photosystem II stability/assembly factor-like uncharacterized protein